MLPLSIERSVERLNGAEELIVRLNNVSLTNQSTSNGQRSDQATVEEFKDRSTTANLISKDNQSDNHRNDLINAYSTQCSEELKSTKLLYINTNLPSVTNATNGLHQSTTTNGLIQQQQSPTTSSSTASSLSLPVDMDSIDDGIHLNSELNSIPEPSKQSSRDYRTHEEFVYAMKEDLAEWLNNIYDLQLNVHNFMDQIGTGVIVCRCVPFFQL